MSSAKYGSFSVTQLTMPCSCKPLLFDKLCTLVMEYHGRALLQCSLVHYQNSNAILTVVMIFNGPSIVGLSPASNNNGYIETFLLHKNL